MKAKKEVEVIARGVCVKKGQLLVCHSLGAANTYLPGGHVEFCESAKRSLVREIEEEMGEQAEAGRFLGLVEHTYVRNGARQCEVNLCFELRVDAADPSRPPPSAEPYIEFQWVPLKDLRRTNLEPRILRTKIVLWLRRASTQERWGSTY